MPVPIGTKLGTYTVTSHIGSGGMGEVYQAHDSKLGRDVAIKVLPEQFARDPERLARFQREAKMLAALNHPNIAAIYGLEESGSTHYLVMELVPGDTLRERVAGGQPVPVEEALTIAKQIAEALEAAHNSDKGIIHRDLKPANVKVTPEGRVKVLDFGLAKAFTNDASSEDIGNSPTLSMAATVQGVILGTAAYMSPEQARGKAVTKATDIFAFGAVLYELLTGKQAFQGEDVGDILATVVKMEPDWSLLPANTPPSIRTLLKRCLRKDRRQRLQDASSVRIEIEDALSGGGAAAEPAAVAVAQRRRPIGWMAAAALLLLTTIGLGTGVAYLYRAQEPVEPVRFFVSAPDKTVFDSGTAGLGFPTGLISPDGRRIVFTARDTAGKVSLWVRPLDTLAAQSLPGTDDAALPFWSPDSRSLGFFADGKLKRIDAASGPVQTLCDAPTGRGGTWNRDGVILFAPSTTSPIYRVASAGGEPVAVTRLLAGQTGHRLPSFLPDGRHFLYFTTTLPSLTVFVGALDSEESKSLLTADSGARYSATEELLFVRQGTLLRQAFDPNKLELSGDPTPVAEQVAVGVTLMGAFSVSDSGILVYRNGPGGSLNMQLAWFDRAGKPTETLGTPGRYQGVDVSPDGKRIAVHRHDGTGGDVWLFESARRGSMLRFTFDASQDNSMPIWSPDGSGIALGSLRNGKWGIYQKTANGTGRDELLYESDLPKTPMSWFPDGKFLVYWTTDPKTQSDVWVLPVTGEKKPVPFLQTPFNEQWPQISPDGKWIAYTSNETGRPEIYVRPFPSGEGKWQISTNGGNFPRWRRDGKELFYMSIATLGKMISVKVNPAGTTFEYGDPVELFDSGYVNVGHTSNYHPYAVSADGQRFLIPRPEVTGGPDAAATPITVVLNWTAGLKK